jgi:hypothetical protein
MNPKVEVTSANTIPCTHILNSAQYPYLSAVNLCISSCRTNPLPTATKATKKLRAKLLSNPPPANSPALLRAMVKARANAAHAIKMSLTSFCEKMNGVRPRPGVFLE